MNEDKKTEEGRHRTFIRRPTSAEVINEKQTYQKARGNIVSNSIAALFLTFVLSSYIPIASYIINSKNRELNQACNDLNMLQRERSLIISEPSYSANPEFAEHWKTYALGRQALNNDLSQLIEIVDGDISKIKSDPVYLKAQEQRERHFGIGIGGCLILGCLGAMAYGIPALKRARERFPDPDSQIR